MHEGNEDGPWVETALLKEYTDTDKTTGTQPAKCRTSGLDVGLHFWPDTGLDLYQIC
jgi:hypothetical protein